MKYNKTFRILAVAIIISLLALVIPATPAAAASLSLSPTSGRAGTTLTVTGTAFPAGTYAQINFNYGGKAYVQLIGAETFFTVSFTVPNLDPGVYPVQAVDGATFTALTTAVNFTIISAEITLDEDDGPVGTEVEIEGIDYDANEDIDIEYDGDSIEIDSGDDDTNSNGDFTCTIIIPESAAGDHTITVIGDTSELEAEAEFTVESEMSLNPTSGAAATQLTVTGTGFKKDKDIEITFGGSEVDTDIESDTKGSFSGTITVPAKTKGTYEVEVSDGTNESSADFSLTAGVSLDATAGHVGTLLTINGKGFTAGGTITIKYDDTQVATTTADAGGSFSVSFDIPASQHGAHTITASDGTSIQQTTFTMESDAPSTPQPLLPANGVKAKATEYFDWENVTDDSGVTYTLQIATSKEFTAESIVLEKTGLTSSEYTITEEEKLPSVKKEAPYYWRVQAVDSAGNESEWTGAGSFYVGFTFAFGGLGLPQWAIYSLMGLGALLCGFVGFWLGRRSAYSAYY